MHHKNRLSAGEIRLQPRRASSALAARAAFAVSVLLVSRAAHAAREGEACTVTADCDASLHCIDKRCTSLRHENGDGYGGAIVGVDVFGLAGTTAFFAVAASLSTPYRTGWQIAAVVPFTFGPIVHASHQRWMAAIVSFFAWASLDMTAFGASLVQGSCYDCAAPGLAFEGGLLAVGGSLLTWLDAWMARDMRSPTRARTAWFPVVAPAREGALVGLGGVF